MLHLYLQRPEGCEVIADVEAVFSGMDIPEEDRCSRVLEEVEQAKYLDAYSFIDRIGYMLPKEFLSTGCKAALVVIKNPGTVVDLWECGFNARDAIIRNVRDGSVVIRYNDISVSGDGPIDVMLEGKRFTKVEDLNMYLTSEVV